MNLNLLFILSSIFVHFAPKFFHTKSAVFCVVLFCIPGLSSGYYLMYRHGLVVYCRQ